MPDLIEASHSSASSSKRTFRFFLDLQPLGFRAKFHQPPLGYCKVARFERAHDLLAVDLNEDVVESLVVFAEAFGDLVELLRFFSV